MEGISQELANEMKERINAVLAEYDDEEGIIAVTCSVLCEDIERIIQQYVLHEK